MLPMLVPIWADTVCFLLGLLPRVFIAFRHVSAHSDEVEALYYPVHHMIARTEYALYRPFPDSERAERVALL